MWANSSVPCEASEMFHNGDLAQRINQNGLLIHTFSTTERVLRYGENNRVAFFEHPTIVKKTKDKNIKIYASILLQ
jgi:hypothetical protein